MNASQPQNATHETGACRCASRREFVRRVAVLTALTVGGVALGSERSGASKRLNDDRMAVLVDLKRCVGCRRCEWACAGANGNSHGPIEECDDQSVFSTRRNPSTDRFCVVNRSVGHGADAKPVYAKMQCMHCEHPPCVSACLVGAMRKDPSGPVTYDASKCIGCRYCLVACPFERLTYEYNSRFTPRVRKCEFCRHRTQRGQVPACVEVCPVEALQYGRRDDLLKLAHRRIADHAGEYVDHVYGETEGGGTSWLYLSPRPFEELAEVGLPALSSHSPAERSEHIQHTIFKWFAAPIGVATLLATLNWFTRKGSHS
ncbi:MAG: 4Fe-4S dicluster domain-containing protein [Planctomycetes bacterium]|nr:4Fe-4S dicluster domain-containing protein [Planctomycetota bacterium]